MRRREPGRIDPVGEPRGEVGGGLATMESHEWV